MTKYVWDGKDWVKPKPVHAMNGPFIWRDLPPYMSPLGTGVIDGRRARREDLARGNCREIDPSEKPESPKTASDAAREKAYLQHREQQRFEMSERTRERLLRGR